MRKAQKNFKKFGCKIISLVKIMTLIKEEDLSNLRASRRGDSKRSSVILNDWA